MNRNVMTSSRFSAQRSSLFVFKVMTGKFCINAKLRDGMVSEKISEEDVRTTNSFRY